MIKVHNSQITFNNIQHNAQDNYEYLWLDIVKWPYEKLINLILHKKQLGILHSLMIVDK